MIGGWGVPSIRLGTVYSPDLEPVSGGIEIVSEPLEINVVQREAQGSTIRDPDEPVEDPFEAEPPPD